MNARSERRSEDSSRQRGRWGWGIRVVFGLVLLGILLLTVYFEGVRRYHRRELAAARKEFSQITDRESRAEATKARRVEFYREAAFLNRAPVSISAVNGFLSTLSRVLPVEGYLSELATEWNGQGVLFVVEGGMEGRSRQDARQRFLRLSRILGRLDNVMDLVSEEGAWVSDHRLLFRLRGIWEAR